MHISLAKFSNYFQLNFFITIIFYCFINFFVIQSCNSTPINSQLNYSQLAQKLSQEGIQLAQNHECQKLWELLWGEAINESPDRSGVGFMLLYEASLVFALKAPANSQDILQHIRNMMFYMLNAHAKLSNNQSSLLDYLKSEPFLREFFIADFPVIGDFFKSKKCADFSADWNKCLTLAEKEKYIPTFSQFTLELEFAKQHNIQATCDSGHNPPNLSDIYKIGPIRDSSKGETNGRK